MPTGTLAQPSRLRFTPGACLTASVRGLALAAVALAGFVPLVPILAAVGLTGFGVAGLILITGQPQHDQRLPLILLLLAAGLGLAIMTTGVLSAPPLLRGYGLLARSMLAPAGHAELAERVRELTETRTEALDTGAAEIRRIERDLHDGAQARLVAMGMTLDAAGQIIDTNPEAARALLYEARDASVKALAELPRPADRRGRGQRRRPARRGDRGPAGRGHRGRPAAAHVHRRGHPGRAGRPP